MIVSYCKHCEHHEIVLIEECEHSRCLKENCLCIYTKCLTEAAVGKFICEDQSKTSKRLTSALEICYPSD